MIDGKVSTQTRLSPPILYIDAPKFFQTIKSRLNTSNTVKKLSALFQIPLQCGSRCSNFDFCLIETKSISVLIEKFLEPQIFSYYLKHFISIQLIKILIEFLDNTDLISPNFRSGTKYI